MRSDLLSLTPESLVVLANAGLVKRAQKEVDAGVGPAVEEEADGTVVARFRDGATTRLPLHTPLKAASCTCGASTVCRHRVAAVLAYRHQHTDAKADGGTAPTEPWDPGGFSDDTLLSVCGEPAIGRARAALKGSLIATTRPGSIPTVSLPSSTVQFLAPHDLAFAKCDCAKGHGCEHITLAVWAFRRTPGGGVVELGVTVDPETTRALERVESTLGTIAERGLADTTVADILRTARTVSDRAGFVWVTDALEELERQKEAYDRQSALFSSRTCSLLVAEVLARLRAAKHSEELPPRWILGSDEARETAIEQVRLVPLGARLDADADRRFAEIYFAECDTRSVLVLRKTWTFGSGDTTKNGYDLGQMFASSRLSVSALTRGELITRAARRRANGEVDLSAARGMKTSLVAAASMWSDLPEPILLRDLAAYEAAVRTRPPAILRPRRIGDEVHVVAIGRVIDCAYDAADQELTGIVEDTAGHRLILRAPHRTVSPGAVDALRQALDATPRFVSGALKRTSNGWEMNPLAVVGERLLVIDLEKPQRAPIVGPGGAERSVDPLDARLRELDEVVGRGIVRGVASVRVAAGPLADRLGDAGMARVGSFVKELAGGRGGRLLDLALVRALAEDARG